MKTIFEKLIPNDRCLDVYSNDDKTIGINIESDPIGQEYGGYIDLSGDEAESLAIALLDDLGKGWKPYPENKPDYGLYTVTLDDGQVIPATYVPAQNKWHDGIIYNSLPLKVIAYCELPAPFQPEEQ